MSKKQFKGFKGKTGAKIASVGLAAGAIAIFLLGRGISDKASGRPRPNNPYNDNFVSENDST